MRAGPAEILKSNLIAASLFLAAYETMKNSVINPIRDFFTHGFDENGWIIGKSYKDKVLSLDKKKESLRASLLWLKGMSVIDDADIEQIDRIRKHRNELAHELPKFIGTADAEINLQLLVAIHEIVTKLDRWWIREVELTTDPDYVGRELSDSDITSGNMLFIHMMLQIAAGEDSTAYWEEFQKQAAEDMIKV